MDDYIDDLNELQDECAERLITIGGSPVATLAEFSENSQVKLEKADWNKSIEDRLKELIAAYTYLAETFQNGIDVSEAEGDAVTADLYTSAKGQIEKTIWMLDAELG